MRIVVAALLASATLGGCVGDLGQCDDAKARRLVFTNDLEGLPAYEGQALMLHSCGGGSYCHGEIDPSRRFGTPAGLSFDLRLAGDVDSVERLRRARDTVRGHARRIHDAVGDDRMPPGAKGEAVAGVGRAYRNLPALEGAEGREVLRNWLACGAPVVERTAADRPAGVTPIGDVVPPSPGLVTGCDAGEYFCGTQCASIVDDPLRCGDCGTPCSVGGLCADGACTGCLPGLASCGDRCVDLASDPASCGGCGVPCAAGQVCSQGECVDVSCPLGTTECDGGCVDVATSLFHCGGCDSPCRPGETCVAGSCDCGDTTSDPLDCGACGKVCPFGATCIGSTCVCQPPFTECNGACVRTSEDRMHCGACNSPCTGTDQCVGGECLPCGTGVSFSEDVLGIFDASCTDALCHGGSHPPSGLSLELDRAYDAIVNVPSRCDPDHLLVVPFAPEESHLMNKVLGDDMHCDEQTRMPLNAGPLSPHDVENLRGWICAGAPAN